MLEAVNAELRGSAAEGRLSYADLVALGGAWAVRATGGPAIDVPVGAALACEALSLTLPVDCAW